MRRRIFEIIERGIECDTTSKLYDIFMMLCVFVSLLPLTFKPGDVPDWLIVLDNMIGALFVIDYLLRFITEDFRSGKKSIEAFIKYPFTAYAIIDLLGILPWIFEVLHMLYPVAPLRVFRLFRALKVLRAFRIIRYSRSIRLTRAAIKNSQDTLGTVLLLALGYVLIIALIIFNVESNWATSTVNGVVKPEDMPQIQTFTDALYFATVSLTTVGYGDITPKSDIGRLITVLSSFVGVAIIALPSGILTAGYMKALEDEKNNRLEKLEEDD